MKFDGFAKNIQTNSTVTCTQFAKTYVGGNANPVANTFPIRHGE